MDVFRISFVQRGMVDVLVLSVACGVLGTWIVLRGLAFYSHAVGTAAFPGLVLAAGLGFAPSLGAFGAAFAFAIGLERLSRHRQEQYDSLTALALVGALVVGVILASDVFHSGSNIETLLFGSLLVIGPRDIGLAAAAGLLTLAASSTLGRSWLATGFDPSTARALGVRSRMPDAMLLVLIALAVTAALSTAGALLATALFVIPAATTRLWSRRLGRWQVATVVLVAAEGVGGLWLSVKTNAPPGGTIATLSGAVFAATAGLRWIVTRRRMGRRLAAIAAALTLFAVAAAACAASGGGSGAGGGGHGLDVVATTTQIGDWVRNVGRDCVRVHQILQPNSDPHDYEPRPADVAAVSGAKVVFENGDGLDQWMGKVVSDAGGRPVLVVLGDRVPVKLPGEVTGPVASQNDAHWWHDPVDAEAAVTEIRDTLAKANPSCAAAFDGNAAAYLAKLKALDRGIASCMSQVPVAERKLVTDHDAFRYFAKRYGIDIVGAVIPSQTTQAQASAEDVAKLVALIKKERVKAVFPESSINPKLAQSIARSTGASAGFTLYGDTLGAAGSAGDTYLKMEAANADAMVRGFTRGAKACTIEGIS